MTPGLAITLLGLGAAGVYLATYPGGWRVALGLSPSGLVGLDNPTAPGGFTQEQLDYYLGGFTPHLSGSQAAQLGALQGLSAAKLTFGISIGIGALAGWLTARNSNYTKDDREVFALRLGFRQLGQETDASISSVTSDDGRGSLYGYLNYLSERSGGADPLGWNLVDFGLNRIGRQDFDANTQWLVDVLAYLWRSGFAFPR
jgi:hypothetical protein